MFLGFFEQWCTQKAGSSSPTAKCKNPRGKSPQSWNVGAPRSGWALQALEETLVVYFGHKINSTFTPILRASAPCASAFRIFVVQGQRKPLSPRFLWCNSDTQWQVYTSTSCEHPENNITLLFKEKGKMSSSISYKCSLWAQEGAQPGKKMLCLLTLHSKTEARTKILFRCSDDFPSLLKHKLFTIIWPTQAKDVHQVNHGWNICSFEILRWK